VLGAPTPPEAGLAKERQKLSQGRGKKGVQQIAHLKGRARDKAAAAVGKGETLRHKCRRVLAKARDKAAAAVGTSARYVSDAEKI
jgi:hypothetical protein